MNRSFHISDPENSENSRKLSCGEIFLLIFIVVVVGLIYSFLSLSENQYEKKKVGGGKKKLREKNCKTWKTWEVFWWLYHMHQNCQGHQEVLQMLLRSPSHKDLQNILLDVKYSNGSKRMRVKLVRYPLVLLHNDISCLSAQNWRQTYGMALNKATNRSPPNPRCCSKAINSMSLLHQLFSLGSMHDMLHCMWGAGIRPCCSIVLASSKESHYEPEELG